MMDEPQPHCPSFHTKPPGQQAEFGDAGEGMSPTRTEGHPLARPHCVGSQILWLQHDLFPSQPVRVRTASVLASGATIRFRLQPKHTEDRL